MNDKNEPNHNPSDIAMTNHKLKIHKKKAKLIYPIKI